MTITITIHKGHTVNTTLYTSTIHPPDTKDQQVLQIPATDELRELAIADRIAFRIGLWLLHRAQRPKAVKPRLAASAAPFFLNDQHLTAREAQAVFDYHLMRQLR